MRFLVLLLLCASSWPVFGQADYWPTCDSPQQLAPLGPIGGGENMAWNGYEFGAVWGGTGNEVWFQQIFADGTAAGMPLRILTDRFATQPRITWNGSAWALVWIEGDGESNARPVFMLLDPSGIPMSSAADLADGQAEHAENPDLSWSGSVHAVVWEDDLSHSVEMRIVDASGQPQGAPFRPCACSPSQQQHHPAVAWSRASQGFVTSWFDQQSTQVFFIQATRVDEGGVPGVMSSLRGISSQVEPWLDLEDSGGSIGMAYRDGGLLYFANVRPDATGLASEPVTLSTAFYGEPILDWTGAEYGCFWNGVGGAWFQRVDSFGHLVGTARRVSDVLDLSAGSFGAHGYLLRVTGPQALPWGCATPQPPLCPESVDAYSVSGDAATISWLPVPAYETDIAYYQVYRNDELVGRTAYPWFNDVGLSEGMEYDYDIRAVNAGQLVSAPCPTSNITVTTSNQLQLQVERDSTNIDLRWSGGSAAAYRVMRGTSPRSMTEIQRTPDRQATDVGAASGSVCYFYSVDPPS